MCSLSRKAKTLSQLNCQDDTTNSDIARCIHQIHQIKTNCPLTEVSAMLLTMHFIHWNLPLKPA